MLVAMLPQPLPILPQTRGPKHLCKFLNSGKGNMGSRQDLSLLSSLGLLEDDCCLLHEDGPKIKSQGSY